MVTNQFFPETSKEIQTNETESSVSYLFKFFNGEMQNQVRYKAGARVTRVARAHAPSCSAAVYFTAKGAARVASLALPVFDVIDRMYQYLIVTRLLEAYLVTPPLFYQDRVWGSNWLRNTEVWSPLRSHSPLSPPCGGAVSAATFMQSELGQVGLALSQARLECLAPFLAATASERARAHEQWSRHENASRHEHASPLAPHLGGARKGGHGGRGLRAGKGRGDALRGISGWMWSDCDDVSLGLRYLPLPPFPNATAGGAKTDREMVHVFVPAPFPSQAVGLAHAARQRRRERGEEWEGKGEGGGAGDRGRDGGRDGVGEGGGFEGSSSRDDAREAGDRNEGRRLTAEDATRREVRAQEQESERVFERDQLPFRSDP
jgi:hypothetical protein